MNSLMNGTRHLNILGLNMNIIVIFDHMGYYTWSFQYMATLSEFLIVVLRSF